VVRTSPIVHLGVSVVYVEFMYVIIQECVPLVQNVEVRLGDKACLEVMFRGGNYDRCGNYL